MRHSLQGCAVLLLTWANLEIIGEIITETDRAVQISNNLTSPTALENADVNGRARLRRGYYYIDRDRVGPERNKGNWSGRMMNKLRRRTSSFLGTSSHQPQTISFDTHGPVDSDYEVEDTEMAGSFLSSYGGGGGGGGHGGYGKYVNKSAVGLLGFLSLLSLIQNALTTTTTAMAMAMPVRNPHRHGRDGRSTGLGLESPSEIKTQDGMTRIILPLLISVSEVRDKRGPLICVLRQVCETNALLVKEFSDQGRSIGVILNNGLMNILRQSGVKDLSKIRYAGSTGRNGKDCSKYKSC